MIKIKILSQCEATLAEKTAVPLKEVEVLRLPPVSTRDRGLDLSMFSFKNERGQHLAWLSFSKADLVHKYPVISISLCIRHSSRCANPNLIEIVQPNADDHRQNVKSRGQPNPSCPDSRPRLVSPTSYAK